MKRTPLQRITPLARQVSLSPGTVRPTARPGRREGGSRPRAQRLAGVKPAGNPIPPEVRRQVRERSGGRCEIRGGMDCATWASEQHHRKRRRDGGHGLGNLLDACWWCHRLAHAQPALARGRGWIVSAFEVDPSAVPVRYFDRSTWFHDDGTKTTEENA